MSAHRAKRERHTPLSEHLDRRLVSYAAAAGAGLLGLAVPAGAQVVYTPAHVAIAFTGSYALDLNNDGTTDFTIINEVQANCSTLWSSVLALPVAGNAVQGMKVRDRNLASALAAGAGIGSGRNFVKQYPLLGAVIDSPGGGQYSGRWTNVVNRYLGLKFQINGETHFGWARLSVHLQMTKHLEAMLTGYAYETEANTPIMAGQEGAQAIPAETGIRSQPDASVVAQPAMLGLLALGADGLQIWRREQPQAS